MFWAEKEKRGVEEKKKGVPKHNKKRKEEKKKGVPKQNKKE